VTQEEKREGISPVTPSSHLSYSKETATRFDKTSVVLGQRAHNFSAEYELGFRDRNEENLITQNPYRTKLARDRWQRGWMARDRYSDADYKWIEPITDNKAVIWVIAAIFFIGFFLSGFSQ
jgi:hypothetical protein